MELCIEIQLTSAEKSLIPQSRRQESIRRMALYKELEQHRKPYDHKNHEVGK